MCGCTVSLWWSWQRLGFLFLFLAVIAVGCGSPRRPVAEHVPKLEEGWSWVEKPSSGFAIALPPGWVASDADSEDFAAHLEGVSHRIPEVKTVQWKQNSNAFAYLEFWGFGKSITCARGEYLFVPNVQVHRYPQIREFPLVTFTKKRVDQIEQSFGGSLSGPVESSHVSLGVGDAQELRYNVDHRFEDGQQVTVTGVQYLFINGKFAYIILFDPTCDPSLDNMSLYRKIAESFTYMK